MDEKFTIKINGSNNPDLAANVVEWSLDTNIFLPNMFTILVRDDQSGAGSGLKYTDNQTVAQIGIEIEVAVETEATANGQSAQNKIFKGEITAIEPVFNETGVVFLRLRAYDKAHRLTLGKKYRTFGDGQRPSVKEADLVSKIAQESGLIAKVDAAAIGSLSYTYIMQYDQSDWEFLWARAQLLGYQIYVDDKNLHFCPASTKRGTTTPGVLEWGKTLKRFEPRIVVSAQVSEVEAKSWDPQAVRAVESKSTSSSEKAVKINEPQYGEIAVKGGLKMQDVKDTVLSPVMRTVSEANVMAKARFEQHQSQFVRASGELLYGDPRLLAGTEVEIKNVGERFSGKYYVTEAKHTWKRGDYRVRFEVSGRNPYTIRDLLLGREARTLNKIYGLVVGLVTDNNDPKKLGRVKVKYPWLPENQGAELASSWARLITPGAGKERGICFVPEVNDEVLIAFEQGDVNYPYVVGAVWNDKNVPPPGEGGEIIGGGQVNQRIVRSRTGHIIVLDDTAGKEKIIVMDKTKKNLITIDSTKNSISLESDGDMTFKAKGKMIFTCDSDFSLETKTKMTMQATSGANVKTGATEVDLKPSGASVKSAQVEVQGSSQTSIKSGGMLELNGSMVKIN